MPSPQLETFLHKDMTEKGLKKLGQSIELSYSNIQRLVGASSSTPAGAEVSRGRQPEPQLPPGGDGRAGQGRGQVGPAQANASSWYLHLYPAGTRCWG